MCKESKETLGKLRKIVPYSTTPIYPWSPKIKFQTGNVKAYYAFTKPPLLQKSRLTSGGSPNLVVLVEWKVPEEGFMGATNCFH